MNTYLKSHRVTKKEDATHFGLGKQLGKYQINSLEEFYDILYKELQSGKPVSLLEKQPDFCKFVIDLDFKSTTETDSPILYTWDIITEFIKIYHSAISKVLNIDIDENFLTMVSTRGDKEKGADETTYKNGVHLQMPGIVCHHSKKFIIREMVIEEVDKRKLFEPLNLKNKTSDVIDKSIIKSNGWLLYGCCKPDCAPYTITKYMDMSSMELVDTPEPEQSFIFKLSQRHIPDEDTYYDKERVESTFDKKMSDKSQYPSVINSVTIEKLLNNLKQDRVDDYNEWITIGMSLKSSSLSDAFDLFDEFSKRSSKYEADVVMSMWDGFDNKGSRTIGTIYYFSKLDNPEKHADITKEEITMASFSPQLSTMFNSVDMGELFIKVYGHNFIVSNDSLYSWNGFLWTEDNIDKAPRIYNLLSSEFYNRCIKVFKDAIETTVESILSVCEDDESLNSLEALKKVMQKNIIDITCCLKTESGGRGIVKHIVRNIVNDSIKFDEQPYIFCFNNQYIDIRKHPLSEDYLLQPSKELYISQTCGHDYTHSPLSEKQYNILFNKDEVEETEQGFDYIYEIVSKIFPSVDVRALALKILSTALCGLTLEKFIIFSGGGRNGKGLINESLSHMLGGYAYDGNINMLTKPIPENGSPAFANLDKKRFVTINEPNESHKIDVSSVKKITGGGTLNARKLFSNDNQVSLFLTMILECNKKPSLSGEANKAIESRLIEVPFVSTFEENVKLLDASKNIYELNPSFKTTKFKDDYKHIWFAILSRCFYEYYETDNYKIVVPDSIKHMSMEYINKSNQMNEYFEDLIKTDNADDVINIKDELFPHYKLSDYYQKHLKQTTKWLINEVIVSNLTKDGYKARHFKDGVATRHVLVGYKIDYEG